MWNFIICLKIAEDMKKNTKYSGNYDQESLQIKWLWEVLESFDEEMKQSFIFFLTGIYYYLNNHLFLINKYRCF